MKNPGKSAAAQQQFYSILQAQNQLMSNQGLLVSTKKIRDEFADLPISRQRKWQLRRAAEGRCMICVRKATNGGVYCQTHATQRREFARKKFGWEKRYRSKYQPEIKSA